MEIGAGPVQGETSGQGDQGAHEEAKDPSKGTGAVKEYTEQLNIEHFVIFIDS